MYLDRKKEREREQNKEQFDELKKWLCAPENADKFPGALNHLQKMEEKLAAQKEKLEKFSQFGKAFYALFPPPRSTRDMIIR